MTVSVHSLSNWCTIGGTRVHYIDTRGRESGGGLLIVHGYLGSTVPFLELIDHLSRDFRVVMPDLPAFGASGTPECACTMQYYLDFLESFSRSAGLDRCYLAGTSMGANIVVHYAAEHPQQVRGLILLSPFGLHDQDGKMTRIRRWDALLPLLSSLVTRANVHRRLLRSVQDDDRITEELVESYWKPFTTRDGRRATVEITRGIVGGCSMDGKLRQVGQPVLILIGSEDKLISPEDREKFSTLLADERLEIVENSGHLVYLDSPEIVSKKIVGFARGGMK
ncbi:MAG: alpha/beta hydrolase [Spirochaetales bacterium]|nr:alpha/beta hydrolase [Spirochaetales bacterium]